MKPQVGEGLRGLRGDCGGVFLQAVVDDDGAYAYVAAAGEVCGNGCQCEGVGAAAAGDQEQGQVGGVRGGGGAGASGGFDASGAEELFEGGGEVAAGSADCGVQASCASILNGGSFIEIAKCLCQQILHEENLEITKAQEVRSLRSADEGTLQTRPDGVPTLSAWS